MVNQRIILAVISGAVLLAASCRDQATGPPVTSPPDSHASSATNRTDASAKDASPAYQEPDAASRSVGETPHVADRSSAAVMRLDETPDERFRESRFVRAQDLVVAVDQPQIVDVDGATFRPDDEVLGFVVNGRSRAYGVRALSYHHVVNDQIGEQPIAVTY